MRENAKIQRTLICTWYELSEPIIWHSVDWPVTVQADWAVTRPAWPTQIWTLSWWTSVVWKNANVPCVPWTAQRWSRPSNHWGSHLISWWASCIETCIEWGVIVLNVIPSVYTKCLYWVISLSDCILWLYWVFIPSVYTEWFHWVIVFYDYIECYTQVFILSDFIERLHWVFVLLIVLMIALSVYTDWLYWVMYWVIVLSDCLSQVCSVIYMQAVWKKP